MRVLVKMKSLNFKSGFCFSCVIYSYLKRGVVKYLNWKSQPSENVDIINFSLDLVFTLSKPCSLLQETDMKQRMEDWGQMSLREKYVNESLKMARFWVIFMFPQMKQLETRNQGGKLN